MRKGEAERCLVGIPPGDCDRIIQYEEPGEVLLVSLDPACQDGKPVFLRRQFGCDCTDPLKSSLCDVDCAFGRIFRFYHLYPRAVLHEEPAGLVDCHIVGTDFLDVFQLLPGQSHKVLMDRNIDFSLYPVWIGTEQLEIREQSSGDGVLDGHYGSIRTSL